VAAPEYGRIWGGIGTYVSQLLRGMGPRHEVTIFGGSEAASSDPRVTTVPLTNGGGVMANYLKFQLALRRRLPDLIRQYRPDLFVVHHAQMPDLRFGHVRKLGDPPPPVKLRGLQIDSSRDPQL